MKAQWKVALIALAVTGLAACKNNPYDPSASAAASAARTSDKGVDDRSPLTVITDETFLLEAAKSGMFEVEAGRLALQKTTNPNVRGFANTLVTHHSQANAEVKMLAQRRNLALPTAIPEDKLRQLETLRGLSGDRFDRAFLETVGVGTHRGDLQLFNRELKYGRDLDVKAFADKTIKLIQMHHDLAQGLLSGKSLSDFSPHK